MTPDQLTTEQHELRAATQRLLDGSPQRSNGKLTVAGLAAESGIPRHRLYEHHADLVAEFQTAANGGPTPPNIQTLQHQLANALTREQQLIVVNNALADRVRTLTAVIIELTQESKAENIVPFPRFRGSIAGQRGECRIHGESVSA